MFGKKKVESESNSLLNSDSDQNLNEIYDEAAREAGGNAANLKTPKIIKPSIVSEGFEFTGDINKSNGPLNVDGTISGNITVDSLSIGVNGVVSGVIIARSINVKGKLSGKISCAEIVVGGRSIVEGELTYSSITIQRGGVFKGDLNKVKTGPAKLSGNLGDNPASTLLAQNPAMPNAGLSEIDVALQGTGSQGDGPGDTPSE